MSEFRDASGAESGNLWRDDADSAPDLIEPDVTESDLAGGRDTGGRGSIVTLTTVIALLLATGLTVLGIGAADNAVANFDASSWLISSNRGEADRVNGVTARVDTRTKIKDAQNHEIVVSQTDRYLILRDLTTGEVSALDLTTLQVNAVMPTTPGLGVSVALAGQNAFVIDSVRGQVRQLDPRTLTPVGDPVVLPNGLTPGGFDGKGTLWVGVPTEGTVVGIAPGANGAGPKVLQTVTVTAAGHDLVLTAMDQGVAVLDNTDEFLTIVGGSGAKGRTTVPVDQPAVMPARGSGTAVPITIPNDRKVVVVDGDKVTAFTVPGAGSLSPAVAFAGRIYVADSDNSIVYEISPGGTVINQIKIPAAGGKLELEVREGFLFINAPNGSSARVVDSKHVVKDVNKYQEQVTGADRPAPPPTTTPPKPVKSPPGKPQNVTATAGDATATISWRPGASNGSDITKYVIDGGPQQVTVGANQRSVTVTGLTNGQTYNFTVYAVNAIGNGQKANAPAVMPTADVPDPPTSVTATANKDGTVDVTWPAANGGGRKIVQYQVVAISTGQQAPVGQSATTSLKIDKTVLTYGTQYAFTVTAVNDKNASSKPSPASNTVVPFNVPSAPKNLSGATVTNQRGTVQFSWQPADTNGRPITEYEVDDGKNVTKVTGTTATLNGYADDTPVTVKVHAINAAGKGPDATASARTIGAPSITLTSHSAGLNTISATFTPNNKGGAATCTLNVLDGSGNPVSNASAGCATAPVTLTAGGVWPNGSYQLTVSITTAVGTATSAAVGQATLGMSFTVICPNNSGGYCDSGIWAYKGAAQTSGNAVAPSLPVGRSYAAECIRDGGTVVNATPWGAGSSSLWVRFYYSNANTPQTAWFPVAWVDFSNGGGTGNLQRC
jgi:hypothetical protein